MVVKTFGPIREKLGADFQLTESVNTVHELRLHLIQCYPDIQWSSVAVAVNNQYADDDSSISVGDIIALIPPVSGG